MKIEIWSIGKKNEALYAAAIEEFSKRIQRYSKFDLVCIPSKANAKANKLDTIVTEGEQILNLLQDTDALVVLDERGKNITTPQLASRIEKWQMLPIKRLIILIGGAYGISDAVKQKAIFEWSLSQLVFPHQLVRLIACEQVYRAFTIINGENYHHE